MIKKSALLIIDLLRLKSIAMGIGIKSTISTSKTRKITASRKNRRENGIRADDFGSKPHSNGAAFSRSIFFLVERIIITTVTTIGKITANIIITLVLIMSLE